MAITNGYATLAQVKSALRITDTVDDSLLEMAVESASRAIDSYAGRNFYSSGTATRYFAPQDSTVVVTDDLISVTTIESSSSVDQDYDITWSAADYQLEPLNGIVDGLPTPYTQIRATGNKFYNTWNQEATVRITGTWGFASVPISVTQACIIQASRIYKRLDSPLGVAGFGDLGVMRISQKLDPDVAQLVDSYRKVRFA